MCKVITLRLTDEEYKKIAMVSSAEHRPISNFITATVLKDIEENYWVDSIEMAQIKSDSKLLKRLDAGHNDAKKMRGKFIE